MVYTESQMFYSGSHSALIDYIAALIKCTRLEAFDVAVKLNEYGHIDGDGALYVVWDVTIELLKDLLASV